MLTGNISALGIFIIIACIFIFRKTIKATTNELPEAATLAVRHLTDTVRVGVLEDRLDQQETLSRIQQRMQGKQWISAKSLCEQMDNYELNASNNTTTK